MKKILSMVLAVMIAAGSVTAYAVESGDAPVMANGEVVLADGDLQVGDSFIEGDLEYTVLDDGTLVVSCPRKNKAKLTSVTIPSVVNGMAVTTIGLEAFSSCTNLATVTIPDSVTSIGHLAFEYCTSLTAVTIPDSVKVIHAQAFNHCESLTSVAIPDSVTNISYGVFGNCISLTSIDVDAKNESYCSVDGVVFNKGKTALIQYPGGKNAKSYTIPDSVTGFEMYAFSGCTSLTSVTIPDSVTSIGSNAFAGCTSLTSVTIPDSVTSIGSDAFAGCTGLTSVAIPDSVTSIRLYAFSGCTSLTSVTIPDSVTWIEVYVFKRCTSLTSVTIPDSVTWIGWGAFRECTSLTSVTIPDSVKDIGEGAFRFCTSLTSINVNSKNEYYCSIDGILFNKDKTTLIQYPAGKNSKSYTIPDSVTSIEADAFYGCTNLLSVTIPDSITSIGGWAFSGCTSLTSVTIPDSVTDIGKDAFNHCESLTSVTIPNSVTSIGNWAFNYCQKLKDVYYGGTEEEWSKIDIGYYNEPLTDATIHYNSTGPVLTPVKIDVAKPESGNAPDTSGMKAEVANSGEKLQTITIGEDGKLNIAGIADGEYSFTFSANNCAPRAYDVTVSGSTVTGLENGVELHLYGDLNGDGKVNMMDVGKANAHAKNTSKLSGYDLSVSDINGDGKINMQDVGLMNAHAKNTKSLWK